jgi:PEP-CTERM motif
LKQIVCTNPGCLGGGLDYQFYVLYTGVAGIDGVAFGLGVTPANYGAAIAGGALTIATANGGGDSAYPSVLAENFGGTTLLGIPGNNAPLAGGPVSAWGFEEWQSAGTRRGLPTTFYIKRWYSPIQGPLSNFLAPGHYTRVALFTTFGPAGATGAVDPPFDTMPFIGFDVVGGIDSLEGNNNEIPQFNPDATVSADWLRPCDPKTTTNCPTSTQTDLNNDPQFGSAIFQQDPTPAPTPEPQSLALFATGLLGIFLRLKRTAIS